MCFFYKLQNTGFTTRLTYTPRQATLSICRGLPCDDYSNSTVFGLDFLQKLDKDEQVECDDRYRGGLFSFVKHQRNNDITT